MKNIGGAEEDYVCKGLAVWALGQFPKEMLPSFEVFPLVRAVLQGEEALLEAPCAIFDGSVVQYWTVKEIVQASPLVSA